MRAGEKFVVTEFFGEGTEEAELPPAPGMEQSKLQGRRPELVPLAQTTKLVAMALCTGEPPQVIEVPTSPSWRAFVT